MDREFNKRSKLALVVVLLISFQTYAQPDKSDKKRHNQDCAGNCFSAEVLKAEPGDGGCTNYEMRVSHNGSCRYELSHFVVDIPCGDVINVSNSGFYAQVVGKDPTTGLTGLKIDNIGNFGKSLPNFFTIKFTWCNNSGCNSPSDCWQPRVAFKAATCVDYDTVSVSCQPKSMKATAQKQNVKCSGSFDGSISVAVEGGVAPYIYAWSTGCGSSSIQDLPVGTYTVTITDSNGNTVTLTEEITATSDITLSATTVNPTCSGSIDGAINLTAQGGRAPYSYVWSNGATSEDISNLPGGTYSVTATDSIGCSAAATFQLNNPTILITALTTKPTCSQSNGQIDISVSGGVEPYSYQWTPNATSQDLTNVAAGSYTVVIKDANQCSSHATFLLQENNTLRITSSVTPTSCVDDSSGAIDVTVTGGTLPYSYLWRNGATTEDLTGLASGLQRLTVTDANGCTAASIINVFKRSFQVSSNTVLPTCPGEANGSISLTPHGTPPFTYLWSNGETTSSISNISSGQYSVTVTDSTGCSQLLSYFVSNPEMIALTTVSNAQCSAEGAFSIDLSVSGGSAPYSYQWSNGATTEDISGLTSGTYTVSITDSNGCSKTVDVLVAPVVIDWSCLIDPPGKNPLCGSSGNALSTSVANADTYVWSVESDDGHWVITSGQNSPAILFNAGDAGSSVTFTLAVTKNGCTQTCSYTLAGCSPVMSCGNESTDARLEGPALTAAPVDSTASVGAPVDSTALAAALVDSTASAAALVDSKALTAAPVESSASTGSTSENDSGPALAKAPAFQLAAYPNPIEDKLSIGWTADADDYVRVDVVDLYGKPITELFSGLVRAGENYQVEWNASGLTDKIYIYRYSSGTRTLHGKLLKR